MTDVPDLIQVAVVAPIRNSDHSSLSAVISTAQAVPKEGKVFYGQEPPSGESTTTESGVDYQLLSVMH